MVYFSGHLLALPSRLISMINSEMLIFCLVFFLLQFFSPQANEADQKAAQVAQDEVSNKSNTYGIPLLAEAAKQPLLLISILTGKTWGSSGIFSQMSFMYMLSLAKQGVALPVCNHDKGRKFMVL